MTVNGLQGHVVVITGGSSGLGVQLGQALADAGATPVLAARRADRLEALTASISAADSVACDVTDAADRHRLIDTVIKRHGRLDGLVNNAGVGATAPALRTSTEAFERVIDLNLDRSIRALLPGSAADAQQRRAVDRQRRIGARPAVHRRDPRRGLRRLEGRHDRPDTRAGLAVGSVRDPRQRRRAGLLRHRDERRAGDDPEAFPEFIVNRTALNRGGRAGELDEAVLFLLGPGSSYVTGHVLSVDGGMAGR